MKCNEMIFAQRVDDCDCYSNFV